MKIPFSSTSSSPASSFDADLRNSQNATTAGCLSTILRRFFGTGSLRTHPFDCIKESNTIYHSNDIQEKKEGSVTPGLVARLMGLESMPEFNSVPTPESIGRSRSVNSVGYWSEFDPTQRQHRRTKSSLSFREMPALLQQENDEFLVLTFESGFKENDLKPKEASRGELKQGRGDRCRNRETRTEKKKKKKEDMHYNKRSCNKIGGEDKINVIKESNSRPKIKDMENMQQGGKKAESESHSENCSPVSVLDLNEFASDPETLLSEEELKVASSKSRRKLSPELAKSEHPCSNSAQNLILELPELRLINGQSNDTTRMEEHNRENVESWEEVHKLTVEDMHTSKWMPREIRKVEEFEEIGIEFGLQIIDQLLQEIAIELGGVVT